MAKSQETFNKKEKEKKRLKKRQDKQQRKEERKASPSNGNDLESMMAYVDEYGRITDTPPDPTKKIKVNADTIEISIPKNRVEEAPAVRKGKIEFFNDSKGYGFIKEAGTQEKFFVHVNGLLEDVRENDTVEFELERGMKGMNAVKVKKV